jgi:hypothetical protein
MLFDLNECEIGRYLLAPSGILMVSLAIVLQFALIYVSLFISIFFHTKINITCNFCYKHPLISSVLLFTDDILYGFYFFKYYVSFQAILKSPTHNKNVCYHTIMVIGILTLFQLFSQFEVFLDLFVCGSISPLADAVSIVNLITNVQF